EKLFAPLKILIDAFLEHEAKGIPDLFEVLRLFLGERFHLADQAAGDGFSYLRQLRIVLQHLSRDVERQVFAVDDAAHEAEIAGQQIRIIGDEYPTNVKLHLALALGIEQVERLGGRRKQQNRVGVAPF